MKYTLNLYGWSGEFIGISITNEQTEEIETLIGDGELSDIRFELDDHMDIDIWDGDLLHINKPLNNGTLHFELEDEHGDVVLKFDCEDISENGETQDYVLFPTEEYNVLFSVDENKGGICSYEIESDTLPTVEDFGHRLGIVESPDESYWGIINDIIYKGNILEVYDHLDSNGKSSTMNLFKYEN